MLNHDAPLTPPRHPAPVLQAHAVQPPSPCARPANPPRMSSVALLQGGRELEIQHGDAVYRLRLTAMGKLILTK